VRSRGASCEIAALMTEQPSECTQLCAAPAAFFLQQVSGLKKRDKLAPGQAAAKGPQVDDGENVDSERMLGE